MAYNLKIIAFFALVGLLFNSCESVEFCQKFVDNNNEISFVFRTVDAFDYNSESYLFIDDNYWYLDFNQHSMDVTFYMKESKTPHHWFGPKYSLALCLWRPSQGYCAIGLLNKNQTSIDFRQRILKNHKLKEYIKLAEPRIEFGNHFRPNLAFVVNDGKHENLVWFIEQHNRNESTESVLKTELYSFDNNYSPRIVTDDKLRDEVNPMAISQISPDSQILGIYRQILNKHESQRTEEEYGIVVMFKEDEVIKYCWTPDKTLTHSCQKNNLKTLIDCSAYTKTKTTLFTNNSTESQFYSQYIRQNYLKLSYLLFLILFTFIFWGLFLKCYGKGVEDKENQYKINLIFAEEFNKKVPAHIKPSYGNDLEYGLLY